MRIPCPSCPDGNEWNSNGPTGRACPVCRGHGYVKGMLFGNINNPAIWDVDEGSGVLDMDEPDSPYCECGNEPDEDEQAENQCAACGKPLEL